MNGFNNRHQYKFGVYQRQTDSDLRSSEPAFFSMLGYADPYKHRWAENRFQVEGRFCSKRLIQHEFVYFGNSGRCQQIEFGGELYRME